MPQGVETFKRYIRIGAEAAGRILFPSACPSCHVVVSQPGALCGTCWPKLRFLEKPWCEVMGTPFGYDLGEGVVSAEAIANPPDFRRARSAVIYEDVAGALVRQLKFRDATYLAPWLVLWMLRAGRELIDDADILVPVPLHRSRLFSRRYNQSAELARNLARVCEKPFRPEAVVRTKRTQQQTGLGARERESNVRGAFRVPETERIHIAGRSVLLIDDVYTTGATVNAAARALLKSGASGVDVLTFARAMDRDFLAS